MHRPDRPHDETLIELMRKDPAFAEELVSVALEEADQPGGREALMTALRCRAEATGNRAVIRLAGKA
ncbi:hypothetical protein [Thiofaba sp. EF100]|jgi:hypothetical protein|uniref:hypothetical protein n=1 Tax=Thiofaba sp. EF100 TaxID=3121274 RepID=UPI003221D156